MQLLEICVAISVVISALGGLIAFAVVRPINDSVKRIENTLAEIRTDLKAGYERINVLEGKVRELQYSSQKAHDRIDVMLKECAKHASEN